MLEIGGAAERLIAGRLLLRPDPLLNVSPTNERADQPNRYILVCWIVRKRLPKIPADRRETLRGHAVISAQQRGGLVTGIVDTTIFWWLLPESKR